MSLFSGVGGFEIGFERAGIETVLQAEQDPWCLEVLGRHWPNTQRVTDVRSIGGDQQWRSDPTVACNRRVTDGADGIGNDSDVQWRDGVDLVFGGFPCQDVSVAGQRAGLGGARSGLWAEFRRIVSELRPRWVVVENVPGLLSSGHGRDFGRVLLDLEDLGFWWSYGVLDAQFFGVPQRRRRVFVIAGPSRASTAAVLAVCESCGGHSAPSRQAGEDLAATLSAGAHSAGVNLPGRRHEDDVNLVVSPIARRGREGGLSFELGQAGLSNALRSADGGSSQSPEILIEVSDTIRSHPRAGSNSLGNIVAGGVTARYGKGTDSDATDVLVFDERQITSPGNRSTVEPGSAWDTLNQAGTMTVASSIQASAGHGSPRGDGSDNLVVAAPLTASCGRTNDSAGSHGTGPVNLIHGAETMIRRLTPLECERVMGWPDFWTRWTADGREIPDSHRYRMIGNGVVATVAEYIGHRLVAVDRMLEES